MPWQEPAVGLQVPPGLEPPLPEGQLRLLVAVLSAEPGLAPVWNWQRNGVPLAGVSYPVGGTTDGAVARTSG
jgi:hypothetical protein